MSLRWLAAELGVDVALLRFVGSRTESYYRHFFRPKPNGEQRRIDKTIGDLRFLQDRITQRLLRPYVFPDSMHGCVKGRSPLTNAKQHTNQPCVVCVDIESFYPSVTCAQVYEVWTDVFDYGPPIASLLTRLTTRHGHLPQGVPTSGYLANLAIAAAARHVETAASGWRPTFYADDITASGESARAAIEVIVGAVRNAGLAIGRDKTKVMPRGRAQRVTGYNIDRGQPSVPRKKRDKIRCAIDELRTRFRHGRTTFRLERSIAGRISHIRMTNPKHAERLDLLLEKVLDGDTIPW
ncbi:MAG TPA: reverse transcriptase family protein [Steroidobacteraceae bacterium]|jgi:hypothetical protein